MASKSITNQFIIEVMEKLSPPNLADDWDNVGLLVGHVSGKVSKIFVALDLTLDVLEEAKALKVDTIITHHPIMRKPLLKITDETIASKKIIELIKHNISLYSAHTNFDAAVGGTNDILFKTLRLLEESKQVLLQNNVNSFGMGRVGNLPKEMKLSEFICFVKEKLNLENVSYVGNCEKVIKRVALCTGGTAKTEFFKAAIKNNCDAYVCGDLTYHFASEAEELGLCVIDATHFSTEILFIDEVCRYIKDEAEKIGAEIEVIASKASKSPILQI